MLGVDLHRPAGRVDGCPGLLAKSGRERLDRDRRRSLGHDDPRALTVRWFRRGGSDRPWGATRRGTDRRRGGSQFLRRRRLRPRSLIGEIGPEERELPSVTIESRARPRDRRRSPDNFLVDLLEKADSHLPVADLVGLSGHLDEVPRLDLDVGPPFVHGPVLDDLLRRLRFTAPERPERQDQGDQPHPGQYPADDPARPLSSLIGVEDRGFLELGRSRPVVEVGIDLLLRLEIALGVLFSFWANGFLEGSETFDLLSASSWFFFLGLTRGSPTSNSPSGAAFQRRGRYPGADGLGRPGSSVSAIRSLPEEFGARVEIARGVGRGLSRVSPSA